MLERTLALGRNQITKPHSLWKKNAIHSEKIWTLILYVLHQKRSGPSLENMTMSNSDNEMRSFFFFLIYRTHALSKHITFQPMSSMLIRSPHLNLIQLFSQAPLLKWKWRHLQSVLWISWARRGSSVIHGSIRLAPHTKVPAKALTKGC